MFIYAYFIHHSGRSMKLEAYTAAPSGEDFDLKQDDFAVVCFDGPNGWVRMRAEKGHYHHCARPCSEPFLRSLLQSRVEQDEEQKWRPMTTEELGDVLEMIQPSNS